MYGFRVIDIDKNLLLRDVKIRGRRLVCQGNFPLDIQNDLGLCSDRQKAMPYLLENQNTTQGKFVLPDINEK